MMTQAAMTSGRDELCFYVKKTMLVILGISNAAGGKVRIRVRRAQHSARAAKDLPQSMEKCNAERW